jgi:hypothetical protein
VKIALINLEVVHISASEQLRNELHAVLFLSRTFGVGNDRSPHHGRTAPVADTHSHAASGIHILWVMVTYHSLLKLLLFKFLIIVVI